MAIKPVTRMGDEYLGQPSQPVTEFATESLYKLLEDMRDTMKEQHGIGIAAPQIGVNLRVVIFGYEPNQQHPGEDFVPFTVLINPTIEILSDELLDEWEGCLSVPGLRGVVPRYKKIKYSGYDAEGNFFSRKVKDYHARVVQHELDHLEGKLYLERLKDIRLLGYEDLIWERLQKHYNEQK